MSAREHPTELDGLLAVAARRRGEQRLMIVLGVAGLALALVLSAFFLGRGAGEFVDRDAAPERAPTSGDARSLAEAALGEPVRR